MESSTTASVGVVAPAWLQEPLAVLLYAAPGTRLWAYGSSVGDLLSLPMKESPDVVLLYASDRHTASQVEQVRAAWPSTRCIALVRHRRQRGVAKEAGADVVLPHEVTPSRLLAMIEELHNEGSGSGAPGGDEAVRGVLQA